MNAFLRRIAKALGMDSKARTNKPKGRRRLQFDELEERVVPAGLLSAMPASPPVTLHASIQYEPKPSLDSQTYEIAGDMTEASAAADNGMAAALRAEASAAINLITLRAPSEELQKTLLSESTMFENAGKLATGTGVVIDIVEVGNNGLDAVDAWQANDRNGFINDIDGIAKSQASFVGSTSGAALGESAGIALTVETGPLAPLGGMVGGLLGSKAGGAVATWYYQQYAETVVKDYAGFEYDLGHHASNAQLQSDATQTLTDIAVSGFKSEGIVLPPSLVNSMHQTIARGVAQFSQLLTQLENKLPPGPTAPQPSTATEHALAASTSVATTNAKIVNPAPAPTTNHASATPVKEAPNATVVTGTSAKTSTSSGPVKVPPVATPSKSAAPPTSSTSPKTSSTTTVKLPASVNAGAVATAAAANAAAATQEASALQAGTASTATSARVFTNESDALSAPIEESAPPPDVSVPAVDVPSFSIQ